MPFIEPHVFDVVTSVHGPAACACGKPEKSTAHFHGFLRAADAVPAGSGTVCRCRLPLSSMVHRQPKPATA